MAYRGPFQGMLLWITWSELYQPSGVWMTHLEIMQMFFHYLSFLIFFNINWCPSAEVLFQLLPNDDLPIASSLRQWWVGILLKGKLSFLSCVFIHVFIDTNMKSKIYLFWPVIHHDNYYLFQCSNCPRISLDKPMWASSCVLCAWPCHVWSTHFRLLLPQSWV